MPYRELPERPTKGVLRRLYWGEKKSLRKIAKELGCTHSTIRYWMEKFGISRRPRYIVPNLDSSEDLAYILGVLKGDGCAYVKIEGQVGYVQLSQSREEFARSFEAALKTVGLRPHSFTSGPYLKNRKMSHVTYGYSIQFVEWYKRLTLNEIEDIVTEEKGFSKGFVRGFYESEGCSYIGSGNRWELSIVNTDRGILQLMDDLLTKKGFDFRWGSKTGRNRQGYRLRSTDPSQNYRFMKKISPCVKNRTP